MHPARRSHDPKESEWIPRNYENAPGSRCRRDLSDPVDHFKRARARADQWIVGCVAAIGNRLVIQSTTAPRRRV